MLEGTVTVAFVDVENSTILVQQLGDRHFVALIDRIGSMCRGLASALRGYQPRHEGDGWMLVFGSARRALRWAAALQHGIEEIDRDLPDGTVRVRIGLHTGEALQHGADYLGVHVNLAARIASVAPAGAVYVSSLTHRIVEGEPEFVFDRTEVFSLKGFDEPEVIHELNWRLITVNAEPVAQDSRSDQPTPR